MTDQASLLRIRPARAADGPGIEQLNRASVRRLAVSYYSPAQIESFLAGGTLDAGLVEAGSYYVGELGDTLVGSGGWMAVRRGQAARGVPGSGRSSSIPAGRVEGSVAGWSPKPRPQRRRPALRSSSSRPSLAGVPLYRSLGYREVARYGHAMADGATLPVVRMEKARAIAMAPCACG